MMRRVQRYAAKVFDLPALVARELYAGWVASGRRLPWPKALLDTS
jgi:hypothetical protein